MKRVAEKVKDIVEVRPFLHLHDFGADPALTLSEYHFTDVTADLMGKWIDRISRVKPGQGAALALAGFRGVGKSHFLSVVGAIVARPELRARITDMYVSTSADRLSRRHGSVVFVKRGLGTSLVDELKRAVAELLSVNPGTLSDSLYDLLLKASEHAGDTPLVVLIDTALGRENRVARDDGGLISEIAEAADTLGIFVGVALDDDISGADGPNSAISKNFSIDYLDQEHLYKVVDAHIFAKADHQLPLLREIYEYYREVMPGFRWSQQRFMSLYPLHPATVEIAPLIRLYVHDFALLGFASEAGVKILGRPANSLIGLDEVYDSVEPKLRAVPDLAEAFAAYDAIEQGVVAKMPVQQRLHAKLILKGLLLLSLDGQGTTAVDIAASMMIFDDPQSGSLPIKVDSILDSFAEALPGSVSRTESSNETKFFLKMGSASTSADAFAGRLNDVCDDDVRACLLAQAGERFSDVELVDNVSLCTVEWRGSIRRGSVYWKGMGGVDAPRDWCVRFIEGDSAGEAGGDDILWKIAEMAADEIDVLRRFHLLQKDQSVRDQHGDGLSTALHLHSIAVEKIWQRVFVSGASLIADGREYSFGEDAAAAHSLSHLLSGPLANIFSDRYPDHPEFFRSLGQRESARLIAEFFGPNRNGGSDLQDLAVTFAEPLGLTVEDNGILVPAPAQDLRSRPLTRPLIEATMPADGGMIPLSEISKGLSVRPLGLSRESQQLVLSALVAQRQYEFVTSSGNRINHRSLDLQIIWDDIVGLARPGKESFAPDRLLAWAKLITGNSGLKSIDRTEDRLLIIDSLSGWLAAWNESRVLADFDALQEEDLNARIWRTASSLKRSFGAMAGAIDLLVKDETSLEKCLHAIAEHFSDSEAEFEKKKSELRVLGDFTASVSRRAKIAAYVSVCEPTEDAGVEAARAELLAAIDPGKFWASASDLTGIEELWQKFHSAYTGFYSECHDPIMRSKAASDGLREILASAEWSAFESLYRIPWADQRYVARSRMLIRDIRQLACDADIVQVLKEMPYCTCSFTLTESRRLAELPEQLRSTIALGLSAMGTRFSSNSFALLDAADSDAMRATLTRVLEELEKGLASFSGQDLRLLKVAAERAAEDSLGAFSFDTADEPDAHDLFSDGLAIVDSAALPFEAYSNT